ncbi:MAG: hypothetical protein ACOYYU_15865 [Chloroflexota bacterium]
MRIRITFSKQGALRYKRVPVFLLFVSAANLLFASSLPEVYAYRTPVRASPVILPLDCSQPVDADWIARVKSIRWVDYSSPSPGASLTAGTIARDLIALKKAGFTGLVTYGSLGKMGRPFLAIAQTLGFEGVIMGIWSPSSQGELKTAREAASLPIVMGYSIGSEGLYRSRERYNLPDLCNAISELREATGKPVATSEEIDDYLLYPELRLVGDWLFPISHSYWHGVKYVLPAVRWQQAGYAYLSRKTDRFILFKEVGLPTDGAYGLSDANLDLYYRELAKTEVQFVYFEAFDQPSKTGSTVEPYWGIFQSDRTPKSLAWNLMGYRVFPSQGASDGWIMECAENDQRGCEVNTGDITLLMGDDRQNRQYRAFLSFETALLPDEAMITFVKLKLKSAGVVGNNPFKRHGDSTVEVCSLALGLVPGLPAKAFQNADCIQAGVFDPQPVGNWYTAELDPASFPHIDLAGGTHFRLQFSIDDDNDSRTDLIEFYSGEAAESVQPVLTVRYDLP